jgi:hypothetical protein
VATFTIQQFSTLIIIIIIAKSGPLSQLLSAIINPKQQIIITVLIKDFIFVNFILKVTDLNNFIVRE